MYSLQIPCRLRLAPRQEERNVVHHAEFIDKQQGGIVVLHVDEAEEDEVGPELGDAGVDVVGVEGVVADGEEEGTAVGREDVGCRSGKSLLRCRTPD